MPWVTMVVSMAITGRPMAMASDTLGWTSIYGMWGTGEYKPKCTSTTIRLFVYMHKWHISKIWLLVKLWRRGSYNYDCCTLPLFLLILTLLPVPPDWAVHCSRPDPLPPTASNCKYPAWKCHYCPSDHADISQSTPCIYDVMIRWCTVSFPDGLQPSVSENETSTYFSTHTQIMLSLYTGCLSCWGQDEFLSGQ